MVNNEENDSEDEDEDEEDNKRRFPGDSNAFLIVRLCVVALFT